MKVKATAKGFYVGPRRAGDVFDMAESAMKKVNGKLVMPSWVAPVAEPKPEKAKAGKGEGDELV